MARFKAVLEAENHCLCRPAFFFLIICSVESEVGLLPGHRDLVLGTETC